NAQARGVLGAEVVVNDDDGESKFHPENLSCLARGLAGVKLTSDGRPISLKSMWRLRFGTF
ncbi:MAG: hypothetical protein ACO3WO_08305, partial [Burkholderiaceae bacterium]